MCDMLSSPGVSMRTFLTTSLQRVDSESVRYAEGEFCTDGVNRSRRQAAPRCRAANIPFSQTSSSSIVASSALH